MTDLTSKKIVGKYIGIYPCSGKVVRSVDLSFVTLHEVKLDEPIIVYDEVREMVAIEDHNIESVV